MGFNLDLGAFIGNSASSILENSFMEEDRNERQEYSSSEAQKARDWSERMSNTSYQRAVSDITAAGLNPALAYMHGGATTPSSSMGTSSSGPPNNPKLGEGVVAAAQVKLMEAQADRESATADSLRGKTDPSALSMKQVQQSIDESIERVGTLVAQAHAHWASAAQAEQQTRNLKEEIPRIQETVRQLRGLTALQGVQAGKTAQEMAEIKQRVEQNLPSIEAALRKYESALKGLEMPQAYVRSQVYQNQATGALAELLRAFNPLQGIFGR